MKYTLAMKFVNMRAEAEKKVAQSECLGVEHIFLGLLKLAELNASDIVSAAEFAMRELEEDIEAVRDIFKNHNIDTNSTRGHLRYVISDGSVVDDVLLEKCLSTAGELSKAANSERLRAKDMLTAIIQSPSNTILQVCPIVGAEKENEAGAEEMSIAFLPELTSKVRHMRAKLLSTVFGQDHVIHAFAEGMFAAEVVAAGDEKRECPRAVFVFAGPPGVGKTFLAEQAAHTLDIPYKRFDMTSYADHQSYMGLIGFEKSYHEAKKGTLTGFVKAKPHSILLFDEIEKAHPNTINLFLQMLDAGRLHDRFLDEVISFKDTIIIFTTNAGSNLYEGEAKQNAAGISKQMILDALETDKDPTTGRTFFPEAITSRMATGWPLLFNHLQPHHLERISSGELARLCKLFEKQYGIKVKYDDMVATSLLLQEGGDVDARSLRAQTELFFKNEIFKLCRLWGDENLLRVLEGIEGISIVSGMESVSSDIQSYFRIDKKPELLLFCSEELAELCKRELSSYTVYSTQNIEEALCIAGEKDISLALIDIAEKNNPEIKSELTKSIISSDQRTLRINGITEFDYSPMTSGAIKDGNYLFKNLRERLSDLPIYLLETSKFVIDPELEVNFVRSGARGKLSLNKGEFSVFEDRLLEICRSVHMQKAAARLSVERKAIYFETFPSLGSGNTEIVIKLKNYTLKRNISANDNDSILDELEKPTIRFCDVIGAQQAKDELSFFIEYLQNPKRFTARGLNPPKGVLLYGPPGTGKTMLAKAMAGESDVAFIPAVGSSFVTKYQGSGPEAVRSLFRKARKYAPALIFIDEIDAIGRKRGQFNSGHGEEMALNALLAEMDGFSVDPKRPVFVLAATNFDVEDGRGGVGVLDPALTRRFDCKILIDLPDESEREALIRQKLSQCKLHDVTENAIKRIASRSVGMSPAILSSIMEMANRIAIKSDKLIDDATLDEAFETFKHGEKKDWGLDYLERVARHEAGHALLSWLSGSTPAYLTIVARGDHGGYMEHPIEKLGPLQTKQALLARIRTSLAGRAAEIVYYGDQCGISTGASGDLANASSIARAMLLTYGMYDDYGLCVLSDMEPSSDDIRSRVNEILKQELVRTIELIRANTGRIDQLVEALLKKNKLTSAEIEDCLE